MQQRMATVFFFRAIVFLYFFKKTGDRGGKKSKNDTAAVTSDGLQMFWEGNCAIFNMSLCLLELSALHRIGKKGKWKT